MDIREIIAKGIAEQKVLVKAWVRSKRQSKNLAFIALNDGSCLSQLQIVVNETSSAFSLLKDVQTGSCIEVQGTLKESPAQGQKFEIEAEDLKILGDCPNDYPLQKKGHSLEFLREIAHLRPRTNTFNAVFRLRHVLAMAIHRFFDERGFCWVHTPIITASDCEGAGEMFNVTTLDLKNPPKIPGKEDIDYSKDFFSKQSHLTVSGQLQGEFMAMGLNKVYTFGPTFRAENSNTTRHLAEFWMLEPEVAFNDLQANVLLAQDLLQYMVKTCLERCGEELHFFEKMYKNTSVARLEKLSKSPFAQLSYTEAIDILKKSNTSFQFPVEWGMDLQTEHERYLSEHVFAGPVAVTDYPKDIKAFYMRCNDDGKTVAAMDILVPGVGELVGGSQREERLEFLQKRMHEMKIPIEDLQWYLDLRRFGTAVHSGFGLGFERMILFLSGMQNIRDVVICPRAPGLVSF